MSFSFPVDGVPTFADDIGWALAGFVERDAAGIPKSGMLGAGPTVAPSGASWKVLVGRFVFASQSSGALLLSGLELPAEVDIVPAAGDVPAGQARIDRIVWDPAAKLLRVVKGMPAANPIAPALGGFGKVAQVRVNAGDGVVIAGQVTPEFDVVGLGGGAPGGMVTAPLSLVGAAAWNGFASWQSFAAVPFAKPFKAPPHLLTESVFPGEAVQFMQVTQVTAASFSGRLIRIGHGQPLAGVVTYQAAEK